MTSDIDTPGASSSTSMLQPGPSPFHESSQYRHWRYSPSQLSELRRVLNAKCVEVVVRNQELEKQAQISLGHEFTDPPPATAYLSVDEELLLLRHYCSQASKIVREGFQLPEVVESTAVTYLKRFYLKNSVMEWHPKIIMPTCVYLAAKTTNYPVLMHDFRERFAKLNPQDILDTEFLVSQSLAFEFWVRGPEKALRGWALAFQSQPGIDIPSLQKAIPSAFHHLAATRFTDAEFIYSPSQISLACLRETNRELVDAFLENRYSLNVNGDADHKPETDEQEQSDSDAQGEITLPYGIAKDRLIAILEGIQLLIRQGGAEFDLKKVKGIDKRLKSCTNPEKVPGTALYIKRKQEQEASLAASKAEKTVKIKKKMEDDQDFFGGSLLPAAKKEKKVMSPRVSLASDRSLSEAQKEYNGMGIKAEGEGLLVGGDGLKEVGKLTEQE